MKSQANFNISKSLILQISKLSNLHFGYLEIWQNRDQYFRSISLKQSQKF